MYICKYFILMLHVFAMVFKCFSDVFASVSEVCFKCFIYLFCTLQLLYLDVSKVDPVLHMGCVWEAAGGADDVRGGVGNVRGSAGPLLVCSLASMTH